MSRTRVTLACILIALACGSDKSPIPTGSTPTAFVSSFVIQGPTPTIGPGETGQVKAVARFSDGTERDVTADAVWSSTQAQIATVEGGLITGRALGRTSIRATYQSRNAVLNIVIRPAGTFIVNGTVREPGPLNVDAATVTVVGSPAGPVTTNFSGFYELFGVVGTVTIRVSKAGYLDLTTTVTVTGDQRLDLDITPAVNPTNVAGAYGVTLTISPACNAVPDEHKKRTYTATIQQTGARLQIQLSDAKFVPERPPAEKNRFEGKVVGNTVTFDLGDSYSVFYYGAIVQEVLPDGQILGIWGTMTTPAAPMMAGNLVGGFVFGQNNRGPGCSTSDSRLVFTRR